MRPIVNIFSGAVIGYKYFDFGEDNSDSTMLVFVKLRGQGANCKIDVVADDYDNGEVLGTIDVGTADGVYKARIKKLTGRHAVYFKITTDYTSLPEWQANYFKDRALFELCEFVFMK